MTSYAVTLVTRDEADHVTTKSVGTAATKAAAMKLAKRAAGRGAKFVGVEGRCEYRGPNGRAAIA